MSAFCLATVVYPAAQPYFADFLDGFSALRDCRLIVARQGACDFHFSQAQIFDVPEHLSVPAVRAALFSYLKTHVDAQYYVFTDIDDRPRPHSLDLHAASLEQADFSYGDQTLFEEELTKPLGLTLFENMNAPMRLDNLDDILRGNPAGLSALALGRRALLAAPEVFPDDLQAVDWYLVTRLVQAGMVGLRASSVTDYRLKGNSMEIIKAATTPVEWIRRSQAALIHFANLSDIQEGRERHKEIRDLVAALHRDPAPVLCLAKEVLPSKFMWYEDVTFLARAWDKHMKKQGVKT